jgi:hypothetical protein
MSHPAHLPGLKTAIADNLGEITLQNLLASNGLGGQMTYRGPPKMGKTKQRLAEAERRLKKIQGLPHDIRTKAHLILTGVYPQVFCASALIPIGTTHADTLRTQVADALLGHSVSTNSAIAIQATPMMVDPQVVLIVNAFNMAQRFLHGATTQIIKDFLQTTSGHDGASQHCKGLANVLNYFINELGWPIDKSGWIQPAAGQCAISCTLAGKLGNV